MLRRRAVSAARRGSATCRWLGRGGRWPGMAAAGRAPPQGTGNTNDGLPRRGQGHGSSRGFKAVVAVAQQGRLELDAGSDVELAEDLVQVVLDGARADEQLSADLGVREAVTGEPRDLRLLRSQIAARFDR